MMTWPWSAVCALAYVYAIVLLYVLSLSHGRLRRLYTGKICIITIAVAMVVMLFFGFVPIVRGLLYYLTMIGLCSVTGLALMDQLYHIKSRKPASVLAHLGIFVILTAGIFGYADKQTVHVNAHLDQTVAEGIDDDGNRVSMPFALTLRSFDIERYEPHLAVNGELCSDRYGDKTIEILKYYDMAGKAPGSDQWQELKHLGAEPAALVRVSERGSAIAEGWVACGSFMFEPSSLVLPDGSELTMLPPSPRQFISRVNLQKMSPGSEMMSGEVSVNHPLRLGTWKIYQSGYDTEMGRWSSRSVFLCVNDPWFPVIRVGLWIIIASGIVMLFTAGGRKSNKAKAGR